MITTATRARTPLLDRGLGADGTLVVAVGAITPERAELTAPSSRGATSSSATAPTPPERLASELEGRAATSLSDVVAGGTRRPPHGVTLFKAMGLGLADLAVARRRCERSIRARAAGANIAATAAARPRLRRT